MNAAAITSAAPAVQHELTRALARRARAHRLRLGSSASGKPWACGISRRAPPSAPGDAFRSATMNWPPTPRSQSCTGCQCLPHSFGPYGLDRPAASGPLTPRTATRLAGPGTVGRSLPSPRDPEPPALATPLTTCVRAGTSRRPSGTAMVLAVPALKIHSAAVIESSSYWPTLHFPPRCTRRSANGHMGLGHHGVGR